MFKLIQIQKQIFLNFVFSSFERDFGPTYNPDDYKTYDEMLNAISSKSIDVRDKNNNDFVIRLLTEIAKRNTDGKIHEDQIGRFMDREGYALGEIAYAKPSGIGLSDVDYLNKLVSGGFESIEVTSNNQEHFGDVVISFENILKLYREKVSRGERLTQEDIDKIKEALSLARSQLLEQSETSLEKQKQIQTITEETKNLLGIFTAEATQEEISKASGTRINNFESRVDLLRDLSAESRHSLGETILKRNDLESIFSKIVKIAPRNDKGEILFTYWIIDSSYNNFYDLLKSYGYVFDGSFGELEAITIFLTIKDYVETQKKVPTMSPQDQFALLVDFNKNGQLENELNFTIGENQANYNVTQAFSSGGIDVFMRNLGFGSMSEFSKEMSSNLYSAREKFQRVLGTFLERGVKPGELLVEGGTGKAFESIYKDQDKMLRELSNELENNPELESKLATITDARERLEAKRQIKLAAIGIIVGANFGIGASFNVKEFTDGFIDSLQIGLVDGVPLIGISKEIFNERGLSVNFSLSVIGPSVMVKKQFDNGLALAGAVSLIGTVGLIGYERIDRDTSAGIEKEVSKMAENVDIMKKDIISGKSFESSKFSKIEGTTKVFYDEFKQAYDTLGVKYGERFLNDLNSAYLNYYRNSLYKEAEGFKFTSFGFGAAAGFLTPIIVPFLYAGGEYISQEYIPFNYRLEEEREATYKPIESQDILRKGTYKGKEVFIVNEGNYIYDISHADGEVQAERKGNVLYISGNVNSITINEYVTSSSVTRTIVINGGNIDKDGMYLKSRENPITHDVVSSGTSLSNQNIEIYQDSIEKTKVIRESIFNIIGPDALNHPKTVGMQKLQRMVFDYSNGRGNLNSVWTQFLNVIKYPGFKEYANEKGKGSIVDNLRQLINSSLTDENKILILQTVPACLMKKEALNISEGKVNVGKTLREYDNRDAFFDKIMGNDFPSLLPKIKAARNEWFTLNGNKSSYTFNEVNDGSIAFSATQSKRSNGSLNVSGLMPYSGTYHVVDAGTSFISIEGKSSEVVNKLPKTYLESLRLKLNEFGARLTTVEDVRNFINNGGNGDIKFNYNLAFAKMGECLNDAIVMQNVSITVKGQAIQLYSSLANEVYDTENNSTKLGVTVTLPEIDLRDKEEESSETEEPEKSETEEPEKSETEEPENSETEEPESSETQTEPESSETQEPESSETQEPESSETQEPESSQTQEPESSETQEPESSQTQEPESSETQEPESSQTQTEPESSETQTEGEGSNTSTPNPQVDE